MTFDIMRFQEGPHESDNPQTQNTWNAETISQKSAGAEFTVSLDAVNDGPQMQVTIVQRQRVEDAVQQND